MARESHRERLSRRLGSGMIYDWIKGTKMNNPRKPILYEHTIPEIFQTLSSVHQLMAKQGFDKQLTHLIQLRASQINQCGYCVKMHTRDARGDGETNERLDRLVVWRHVNDFTAAEKAVFAWTEALTLLVEKTDYGTLRSNLREHYSEKDITVLTTAVAMINLWNRFQISKH